MAEKAGELHLSLVCFVICSINLAFKANWHANSTKTNNRSHTFWQYLAVRIRIFPRCRKRSGIHVLPLSSWSRFDRPLSQIFGGGVEWLGRVDADNAFVLEQTMVVVSFWETNFEQNLVPTQGKKRLCSLPC